MPAPVHVSARVAAGEGGVDGAEECGGIGGVGLDDHVMVAQVQRTAAAQGELAIGAVDIENAGGAEVISFAGVGGESEGKSRGDRMGALVGVGMQDAIGGDAIDDLAGAVAPVDADDAGGGDLGVGRW